MTWRFQDPYNQETWWMNDKPATPAKATSAPLAVPLANTFLYILPSQHYLEYSGLVMHDLIAQNRKSGQQIVELIGNDANAAKVWETIASLNPIVIGLNGHGNYTTTSVECTERLVGVGDEKLNQFKGRIVHLNSCQTGAELGPAIMSAGAIAYVGSNESFWFYVGDPANSTRAVRSPFLAEWQFQVSLLQGKDVGQARKEQLDKYDEELTYWVEGDGKNHKDAGELARIININKSISTFAGEAGTVPSPVGGGGGMASLELPIVPIAVVGSAVAIWYFFLRKL